MDRLLAAIISRPRPVLSTLGFLLVAGSVAYGLIPKEAEPELDIPILTVTVVLEGVSPADAERLLVRPLEERFSDLDRLKEIRATATQGSATVTLEFDGGTDLDLMIQEVRNRVDMARPEMPADIREPQINEVRPSMFPMMIVGLTGGGSERALLQHARQLRDDIKTLPGVFEANITGIREEVAEIVIDPTRVESYGLNGNDLAQTFAQANRLVAAGKLDTGRGSFAISVPGLFERIDDIMLLPVKVDGNAVVTLRDIAAVRRTFKDASALVTIDGKRAAAIEVIKQNGANLIRTADAIKARVARAAEALPAAVTASVVWDGARPVRAQFFTLQNNVILAVFLVMAIVVGALGVRSGLLVGVAIPGSFLSGILVMFAIGVTICFPVMFGLIIAVGMLVDGAIVVAEYADRKISEGLSSRKAYTLAAQRMAWPIISSTATTIAAFVPLLFWPGLPGQMFFYLPLTLICVLTSSLLMALVFVPTLGALIGGKGQVAPEHAQLASGLGSGRNEIPVGYVRYYVQLLTFALKHPVKVICGTVLLLFFSVALFMVAGKGISFMPKQDPRQALIAVQAPGNLAIEERAALVAEVERSLAGIEDFDNIYSRIKGGTSSTGKIGEVVLHLKEWEDRRPGDVVLADVTERIARLPGVDATLQEQRMGAVQGKVIELELSSENVAAIEIAAGRLVEAMAELDGFVNVDDTRAVPGIEWRLVVDRPQAARFGADVASVGNAVRLVTNGLKLGTYRPDDSEDEIDVIVRYPEDMRNIQQLDRIQIQTNNGMVPISNFVAREPVPQAAEISRVDRRRIMTVASDVAPGILASEQVARLKAWLSENELKDVQVRFRGEEEQQQESQSFLIFALFLAMFLMAAILLIEFNSFYSVLLILSSVVLSTIGVFLGNVLAGQPFVVVMSGIGIIALAGIVVNNNIVLIDTFDRLRKTARNGTDAIIQTGIQRLRPVILTTATTALGLLPMAYALSIDFFLREVAFNVPATVWWQQLAATIVFGLLFATILTLVVTPAALMIRVRRQERRAAARTFEPGAAPVHGAAE